MRIKFFFVVAVLATAILCFGATSVRAVDNSALIAQLIAQIQALQAQLQTLQAQQGVTPTWCHTFNTNLGFANSGSDEVGALHTVLDKEGNSYAPDMGNTYYEGTAYAVIQLQTKYGIKQTGYVGPITRAKLNSLYGCSITPSCSTLYWFDSSNTTCSTQKQFCGAYMYQGLHTFTTQQACLASAQPSITVTSPNGGETFPFSMLLVRWTSTGITNANIYLQFPDGGVCFMKTSPASQGEDYITVLNGYQCPNISRTIGTGQYKIFIIGDSDSGPRDFSDNYFNFSTANEGSFSNVSYACYDGSTFNEGGPTSCKPSSLWQSYANQTCQNKCSSITGKCGLNTFSVINPCSGSAQPSITVTSPNGGETWVSGTTKTVTWTTSNIPASNVMTIRLRDASGVEQYFGSLSPSNVGSLSITMPSFILPGQYKLEVKTAVNNQSYLDASDNYFTISAAGTVSCVDSDGGIKYYSKGWLTKDGQIYKNSVDYCMDNKTLFEYDCGYENEIVGSQHNQEGGASYLCPNGCLNGACVEGAQPSITVTSPNGGEKFNRIGGQVIIPVKWSTIGIPLSTVLEIKLKEKEKGSEYMFGNIVTNNGSEDLTISSSIPDGSYYLEIRGDYNGIVFFDSSNSYFTIITQVVGNWIQVGPPHNASLNCNQECSARSKTCSEDKCSSFVGNNFGSVFYGGEKLQYGTNLFVQYNCSTSWGNINSNYNNYCCCM